jgi:hypothetical protein
MTDRIRTGKTTAQMLNAPKRAYYIWRDKALAYPRALAEHLGRKDLTIVTADFFSPRSGKGRGLKVPIIIDHDCMLPVTKHCWLDKHNTLKE